MPKTALWIALVDVHDPVKLAEYAVIARPVIAAFGGVYLVRGGPAKQLDGTLRPMTVVIRFPSLDEAENCFKSGGYQSALKAGLGGFTRDLRIVEELEGGV